MSDQYDFFATPPAGGAPVPPQPPVAPPAPGAPVNQFGTPVQAPVPAPGYGTPAPGYGAPGQQFGAFGVPPQGPGLPAPNAYPGYPGRAVTRPGTVTAAAVMVFVQSVFAILAGAAMAIGGLVLNRAITNNGSNGSLGEDAFGGLGAVISLIGVVVLVVAGLFVFLGVKILGGAAWAAITVTAFEALGLLGGLASLADGDIGGTLFSGALPAAVLICLWVPASRAYFARR